MRAADFGALARKRQVEFCGLGSIQRSQDRVDVPIAQGASRVCSRERIGLYLERFGPHELAELREPDGGLTVTCEFCSRQYRFAPGDVA